MSKNNWKNYDYINKKYNNWKIIAVLEWDTQYVICECKCGVIKKIQLNALLKNKTKSCNSCKTQKQQNKTLSSYPEYKVWRNIKRKCYPSNSTYSLYEEKNIKMCSSWKNSFLNFYKDVGKRPNNKYTIIRKDMSIGFTPENCKWDLIKNIIRSNTKFIKYKKETKTLIDWCKYLNLKYSVINNRLYRGWSVEKAFNTPIQKK